MTTLQACVTGAATGDTIRLATNTPIAESVTVDKSLTIEPAPGFAPSVDFLYAPVTSTSISFTVQNLAGLNGVRGFLGAGGGSLTLRVLNNVIHPAESNSAVEVTASGGGPGPYGTVTALVSGNRINATGGDTCSDAVSIVGIGIGAGFDVRVDNNDITVNNLYQCGGIFAYVAGGATATATVDRNLVHGASFDYGINVTNSGFNPGTPGGLLTAQVSNNLVYGQNGNTGAPAGLVASASGYNAALAVQLVNNTIVDGRLGVLVGGRPDLGASITGGLFNNVVAFNSQYGIEIEDNLPGFSNAHNLTFGNGDDYFVAGPGTVTADPRFVNRPARDYSLAMGSPAINAGLDSALPSSFILDLPGGPRRVSVIDIGAYEAPFVQSVPALTPGALAMLAVLMLLGYALVAFPARRRR